MDEVMNYYDVTITTHVSYRMTVEAKSKEDIEESIDDIVLEMSALDKISSTTLTYSIDEIDV